MEKQKGESEKQNSLKLHLPGIKREKREDEYTAIKQARWS
jgi:hypothetical protein